MDSLFGIGIVAVWIVTAVVALKRAFGSRGRIR
jgi:hypothetical protein